MVTDIQANAAPSAAGPALYTVARGDVHADRDRVLRCWREFGSDFSRELMDGAAKYDWFYLNNPAGEAEVYFLEHGPDRRVVGVVGVGARDVSSSGRRLTAGLLVDFIVQAEHRVFYPALLLQRTAARESAVRFDCLVGHSNPASSAVLRRVPGFQEHAQVRYVRVLDIQAYLARYVPGAVATIIGRGLGVLRRAVSGGSRRRQVSLAARWTDEPDDRFDRLWARASAGVLSMGVRDRRFIAWRFFGRQRHRCRILEIAAAPEGALIGYFICDLGGDSLVVQDLWLPEDAAIQDSALAELVVAAQALRRRSVSIGVVATASLASALERAGFWPRDSQPVLIAPTKNAAVAPLAHWYVTMADADV